MTDSFCNVYQQVIRTKAEAEVSVARTVKERLLANELTYRCLCKGEKAFCEVDSKVK